MVVDSNGVSTNATVADTVPFFGEDGGTRILAVSQYYHLPRIKLAYQRAGWNVLHGAGRYVLADPADAALRGARDPGLLGVLPGGRLPLTGGLCRHPAGRRAHLLSSQVAERGRDPSTGVHTKRIGLDAPTENASVVRDGLARRERRPEQLVVAELAPPSACRPRR